jgi:formylglycine-generating enzyme required for sulfatase activity
VHALVHPSAPPRTDQRLQGALARWAKYQQKMADGQGHVDRHDWCAAHDEFCAALELMPHDPLARVRLEMCHRRLHPELPGFCVVGERFDLETGLPSEVRVEGLDISMLLVPPGELDIGSAELSDAQPVHTIRIDGLYLGKYELTQAQWKSVMGTNPSAHTGDTLADAERMPVERVSWHDSMEFVRRLNERICGGGFRLPTEVEWEYACRAGRREPPAANSAAPFAWFRETSVRQAQPDTPFRELLAYAPRPVGLLCSNAWGFFDMQGNVWEWSSSLWRPYVYDAADGRESLTADGLRVLRGGSFADAAWSLDPALRHSERPHRRLRWNGLRLARSIPSVQSEVASAEAKNEGPQGTCP